MGSVTPELLLRKDELSVSDDLESPPGGVDELDACLRVPLFDGGRQTDGSRPVVSDYAILDCDIHAPMFADTFRAINPGIRPGA